MSNIEEIDKSNFENKVLKSNKPIIVDFWAEWCGPCKTLSTVLDEIADEVSDAAQIMKVNVDKNQDLAKQYGIRGIPTLIFFKDGQATKTLVGNQTKEEIKKTLEDLS